MTKPVAFAAIAALSATLLAGCGNKGPLLRPSEVPPPPQAMPAVVPAPANGTAGSDAAMPLPPAPGDGD